jgi:hypothetical protein
MYSEEFLKNKIDKLCDLYDFSNPVDFFTLLPQEMELVEVRGIINSAKGNEKKDAVVETIMGAAINNQAKIPKEWVEVFIDIIIKASKGEYALNKERK